MKHLTLAAAVALLAMPAFAQDAADGEAAFGRQCIACHVIQNPDGDLLAGRSGRTGPNLFGIVGEAPAAVEDFNFSAGLKAWGETDDVWTEEQFVGFVMNPTGHVRERTGNNRLRAAMAYQVRSEDDAKAIWAFLESIQPEHEGDEAAQ